MQTLKAISSAHIYEHFSIAIMLCFCHQRFGSNGNGTLLYIGRRSNVRVDVFGKKAEGRQNKRSCCKQSVTVCC